MREDQTGRATTSPVRWVARVLGWLCLAAAAVVLAGYAIGWLVAGPAEDPIESGFDFPVIEFFHEFRTEVLTDFMEAATVLGGGPATVALLILGGIASFLVTRQPRWPIFFAGVIFGAYQSYTLIKRFVGRPRPTLSPLDELASKAFPSGHAAAAAACFGALGYFALRALPRPWSLVGGWVCGALILLIGLTRVYLGVHWPTDVIGGWALGIAWVAIVAAVVRPQRRDARGAGGAPAGRRSRAGGEGAGYPAG